MNNLYMVEFNMRFKYMYITKLNKSLKITIDKIHLTSSNFWFYDEEKGIIRNKNNSLVY